MTLPTDVQSLEQVRAALDQLDRQIVALLAQRGQLVCQAAKFKQSLDEIHSAARADQTLAKVRLMSQEVAANPGVVQQVYRKILAAFSILEQDEFRRLNRPDNLIAFKPPSRE